MSVMEQQTHRPRAKSRTFSFKSDKSHTSAGKTKEPLKETPEEKRRSQFTTKANPNAAMNEAQPVAAALEAPTLGSLRSIQHLDSFGNLIAEPDLSNPTRPRWERPLDTIRSFEAAIDSEYKRRSVMRADTSPADYNTGYNSRRSSYYGGYDQNPRYSQYGGGGYYGSRTAAARDSYVDNSYGPPPVPTHKRLSQRMYSDPSSRYSNAYNTGYGNAYNNSYSNGANGANVYPTQGPQQSRDTVHTGASSGSEPWTNGTDPSSDNSSIERTTPPSKPDIGEQYGFSGFGGAPILEEYNNYEQQPPPQPSGSGYFQPQHSGPQPVVPPKYNDTNNRTLRKPVGGTTRGQPQPLAATSGNVPTARPALAHSNSEKRKSWFKRRFSKA